MSAHDDDANQGRRPEAVADSVTAAAICFGLMIFFAGMAFGWAMLT